MIVYIIIAAFFAISGIAIQGFLIPYYEKKKNDCVLQKNTKLDRYIRVLKIMSVLMLIVAVTIIFIHRIAFRTMRLF